MYEEWTYQTALSYRGDDLFETCIDLLRKIEASARTMSMKRRVKAKIAEALGRRKTRKLAGWQGR